MSGLRKTGQGQQGKVTGQGQQGKVNGARSMTTASGHKSTAAQGDYAGDVDPQQAWDVLSRDPRAVLIDVRTRPEWVFVGTPDLSALGKELLCFEWQVYPTMARNEGFTTDLSRALAEAGVTPETPLFFLCRSGARSRAAAIEMTAEGYRACFNVSGGFEGDLDANGHRGRVNGWIHDGLPWKQR